MSLYLTPDNVFQKNIIVKVNVYRTIPFFVHWTHSLSALIKDLRNGITLHKEWNHNEKKLAFILNVTLYLLQSLGQLQYSYHCS